MIKDMKREDTRVYLVVQHSYGITPSHGKHIDRIHACFTDAARAKEEAEGVICSGEVSWREDVSVIRWSTKTQAVKTLFTFSPTVENCYETAQLKKIGR